MIGGAENFAQHLALPRGCLDPVQTLLQDQGIGFDLVDERQNGSPLELVFTGPLPDDQEAGVEAMLRHDIGVLQAPTAFVTTVVAASILARRDGLQPILFMRCGPIRHAAKRPAGVPQTLERVSRTHQLPALPADLPIQELMRRLAEDQHRTVCIVAEGLVAWEEGRKLLLLSERTDHITAIAGALTEQVPDLFLLHRQQSGKTSVRIIDWLDLGHPVPQRPSGGGHVQLSAVQ